MLTERVTCDECNQLRTRKFVMVTNNLATLSCGVQAVEYARMYECVGY